MFDYILSIYLPSRRDLSDIVCPNLAAGPNLFNMAERCDERSRIETNVWTDITDTSAHSVAYLLCHDMLFNKWPK